MEGKCLFDEVLYAQIVGAALYGVGAEHLEVTFIIISGLDGACTVHCDEVAALFVGDHAECSAGIDLYLHV